LLIADWPVRTLPISIQHSAFSISSWIQESPSGSLRDGSGPRRDAKLSQNICKVAMDGVVAYEEAFGDRLIIQAFSNQSQDLDFAFRQPAIPRLHLRFVMRLS
jgi:hypothetical protein